MTAISPAISRMGIPWGPSSEAQFESVYQQHQRKVYLLCLRMIGSHEDAEDVTQEVFLQVHRKLHTYRGDASLSTWLHRVTVNAVLMHFRRSKKWSSETQTEDGDIEAINLPTSERKSDSLMVDRLALKKAVAHLSPGCQTIFMLHDVEGYEHKEIAQRLGISEGTSKSQLHDARLKMRKHLNGQSLPAATRR